MAFLVAAIKKPVKWTLWRPPDRHLWPSAMMKHQATKESWNEIALRLWQSSLSSSVQTELKKHLLKTHFIAPKLSHLIKLTVTEQATRGGSGGDWEIVWCHNYVTLKCTFHSPLARWSFQACRGVEKRQQCPNFKIFSLLKASSKWHCCSAAIWLHHCLQHLGL